MKPNDNDIIINNMHKELTQILQLNQLTQFYIYNLNLLIFAKWSLFLVF